MTSCPEEQSRGDGEQVSPEKLRSRAGETGDEQKALRLHHLGYARTTLSLCLCLYSSRSDGEQHQRCLTPSLALERSLSLSPFAIPKASSRKQGGTLTCTAVHADSAHGSSAANAVNPCQSSLCVRARRTKSTADRVSTWRRAVQHCSKGEQYR